MKFQIESEKVRSSMSKILYAARACNYKKEIVEHLFYVLFRQIKNSYNTYNAKSGNSYMLESFLNFNQLRKNFNQLRNLNTLKQYDFDSMIKDFLLNKENICNVDDFSSFLNRYFLFAHKSQKNVVKEFVNNYLNIATQLTGEEENLLTQTPIINNEHSVKDLTTKIFPYFNEKDRKTNIYEMRFHKTGNDRGVILNFHYIEILSEEFVNKMVREFSHVAVSNFLNDTIINLKEDINKIDWNPKRYELVGVQEGILSKKRFNVIHNVKLNNEEKLKISNMSREYKMHWQNAYHVTDENWKNKLIIRGKLEFSFEEYFDFILNRLTLSQNMI